VSTGGAPAPEAEESVRKFVVALVLALAVFSYMRETAEIGDSSQAKNAAIGAPDGVPATEKIE